MKVIATLQGVLLVDAIIVTCHKKWSPSIFGCFNRQYILGSFINRILGI